MQFIIDSHTNYLNNILNRNSLRLSNVDVPSDGDCMFISVERAYTQNVVKFYIKCLHFCCIRFNMLSKL